MNPRGRQVKVLLVEANDMAKWVGGGVPYEVHVPPLGLMYLAAAARAAVPGAEIRIIESSLDAPGDDAFVRILEEFRPDVVGIRSILFFLEETRRIAALARAHSRAAIVAGGPIVKAWKDRLFADVPQIDMAVKGEGEVVFTRLLAGESPAGIPGMLYRDAGRVVENPDAAEIEDVDGIPFPAADLVDLAAYEKHLSYSYNRRRQGVLLTSRGCAFSCTFCFDHSRNVRLRSAENVFAEIESLYHRHGVRDFYIVDDIFNLNQKRALLLFDKIVAAGLGLRIYFANGLRTDLVSEEFVDRAIRAGAIWFTFAIESGSPRIQNLIHKRVDLDKARQIIAYTQRQGVAVNISTMFGFPTETRAEAYQTLDWLGELPKPSLLPYHFCLRFFPGCDINQQALDAGWTAERLDLTGRFSYNDLPMGTPTLSKHEMNEILLEYHRRFGLSNPAAVRGAVATLQAIGYSDEEIRVMYSVLKRKVIHGVGELVAGAS